jgi:hypothetical protein
MLKITIPTRPGLYGDLASDPRVLRVIALSGGYSRDEACARLERDPTLIASFSRALLEGLTENQTDEQFNAQLESSIEQIYQASVHQPLSPPSHAAHPRSPLGSPENRLHRGDEGSSRGSDPPASVAGPAATIRCGVQLLISCIASALRGGLPRAAVAGRPAIPPAGIPRT